VTRVRYNPAIASTVAVFLMVTVAPVQATLLAPGGTVASAAVLGPLGALLADTGLETFSFGSPVSTGTVREVVVADANNPFGAGRLSFVYQVRDTTGDVGRITGSSYAGFLTDVGTDTPIVPFFTSGIAMPITIDRTAGVGAVVGFNFMPFITPDGGSSDTSVELIIRTDATMFAPGSIGVIDGGATTLPGFAPSTTTPEPASIVLFGLGVAGICGYGWKRRKVTA
jgi:hypothetical protein